MAAPASTIICIRNTTSGLTEPAFFRWFLIATALTFLALFLVLPLAAVFSQAFEKGLDVYLAPCASRIRSPPSS